LLNEQDEKHMHTDCDYWENETTTVRSNVGR